MLKHQLWWDKKSCSTKCFLVHFNLIPQHVTLEAHTSVGQNSWTHARTLMRMCRCYLQSCRIPYVFLCSCILEPFQDLHFTPFICKPRRSVERPVLSWRWLFFSRLKTHKPSTTPRMPGNTLLKKGSRLPCFMTNAMRKCKGLSVVCLNMSSVTFSLCPVCLHNQSCMFCAIWPHFARTPTVSHTTKP